MPQYGPLGRFVAGPGGGGGERLIYASADDVVPMRGGAAELVLPGSASALRFHFHWFYGGRNAMFGMTYYRGFCRAVWTPQGAHGWSLNNQNGWYSFGQDAPAESGVTHTVGILNRTGSTGWSLEYDPDSLTLSLDEYAETGRFDSGIPNVDMIRVFAI